MTTTQDLQRTMDEGNLDEALHLCNQLLAHDPQNLELRIVKSRLLSLPQPGLHDRDGAVQVLVEALKWHSASAGLHEALGDAYAEARGDYSEAAAKYKEALARDPKRAQSSWKLGRLFQHPGVEMDVQEAIHHLNMASVLDPSNVAIHRDLGMALWQAGDLEHAGAELQIALKGTPASDENSQREISEWLGSIEAKRPYYDSGTAEGGT